MAVPKEDKECAAFARYLELKMVTLDSGKPGVLEFSHIGNESGQKGTKNIIIMMAKKKRMGVRKGIPDYFIAFRCKSGDTSCLWIEMKRQTGPKGGMNSEIHEEQIRWIDLLNKIPNTAAHFAYGFQDAREIYEEYEEM